MSELKQPRREDPSRALVYAGIIGTVQKIGRQHGYAIAVHGSMATDLDLIAAPWTEEASQPDALIDAIAERLGAYVPVGMDGSKFEAKPHGRQAYSLHWKPAGETNGLPDDLWSKINRTYLDISVLPKVSA